MKPISQCQLYAFVDTAFLHGRAPETLAKNLCDGGADIIQLRAKASSDEEILKMAEAILPVTRQYGVPLVINDSLEVARRVNAEYCHLGQEDFFDANHRNVSELLRPGVSLKIGLSSHAPQQALRAVAAGADYLGVGPVYPTKTKPEASPVTLDYVRWVSSNVSIPWFAIGGINLSNLEELLQAGARRICVVSAILNADDVTEACREFKRRLQMAQNASDHSK
jgi:thiamine-phosphate pyrophosphorylase